MTSSWNIYFLFNCDANELLRAINVLFILPENWNGKEIMQILNGFQVCGGRIWGPSRIEINVSTAGKWPQFSENAILWSLNARTHTHCVWKF